MSEKKESPKAKPDDATGAKPQHTQDVENTEKNAPAKVASDDDNDGKADKAENEEKKEEE